MFSKKDRMIEMKSVFKKVNEFIPYWLLENVIKKMY